MTDLTPTPTPTPNVPLLRKAVEFAEASAARQKTFREDLLEHGATPEDLRWYSAEKLNALVSSTDPDDLTWRQDAWSTPKVDLVSSIEEATVEHCGTSYCIAGFVNSQHPEYAISVRTLDSGNGDGTVSVVFEETISGQDFMHGDAARDALGITNSEANALFDGDNTIRDVRRIAEQIAGERL